MDYEAFYMILPKEPKKWSIQDVAIWLDFIGLQQLVDKFIAQSIDGSILELIEDHELEEELGITQKIVKKKILNWLNVGLKEYSQFIKDIKDKVFLGDSIQNQMCTLQKERLRNNVQEAMLQSSLKSSNTSQIQLSHHLVDENEDSQIQQQQPQQKINLSILQNPIIEGQRKSEHQLILQPLEGQQNNFYCVKESGAKIGRHSKENISRYHAQISFDQSNFTVMDIGSTTGTYIKIQKKMELEAGIYIELGSNLFLVQSIQCSDEIDDNLYGPIQISLVVEEGPNQMESFSFILNSQKLHVMMGRKGTADLSFPDDHHLSNLHSKFYLVDQKVYIEDYSSTNGSWLRLSAEGQISKPYQLQPKEEHIIRIGTTNQYLCTQNSIAINEIPENSMCVICYENEKDVLFLPCKHNAACLKCSKNFIKCPICRVKIQEHIRIYK